MASTRGRWRGAGVFLAAAAILSTGCLRTGEGAAIDLSASAATPVAAELAAPDQPAGVLVFAVAAVNSSRASFPAYQDLAAYLGRALGLQMVLCRPSSSRRTL